jgi:hypothetical protein
MAVCSACGETLIGSGKFCASCGAPASGASVAPGRTTIPSAPPAVSTVQPSSPPPRASSYGPPPTPAVPSSGYGALPTSRQTPTLQPHTNQSPPYASSFPAPFAVGAHVLVQWADGNRYPGIVQQIAPGQCLIVFPDGQQRWVDNQFLSSPR